MIGTGYVLGSGVRALVGRHIELLGEDIEHLNRCCKRSVVGGVEHQTAC